jgi:hypothetical protein
MTIDRRRYIHTDGTEEEYIFVGTSNLNNPEATEQFGHDLLQAAAEWRAEIETRGPPGVPAYKVFEFVHYHGGRHVRIASWVEHPWALVLVYAAILSRLPITNSRDLVQRASAGCSPKCSATSASMSRRAARSIWSRVFIAPPPLVCAPSQGANFDLVDVRIRQIRKSRTSVEVSV